MRIILVLAAVMGLFLPACSTGGDNDPDGRLEVVAALYPIAEVARAVGGDAVRVTDLTPAGVEPHDFELKPSDVDLIQDADLVVVIGGGFQPAVERAAARGGATTLTLLPDGEDDPHIWLNPDEMRRVAGEVAKSLSELRESQRPRFVARAEEFGAAMTSLDGEFRAGLSVCQRRAVVTAHGAFGHLARRYGLEQLGIAGIDPSAEPSPARLDELASLVRLTGVTTIFTETLVSPAVAEALAREAGVRTAVLDPIEGLAKRDADDGVDYAALMRRNLVALRAALDCG